jgi:hypothetical protein
VLAKSYEDFDQLVGEQMKITFKALLRRDSIPPGGMGALLTVGISETDDLSKANTFLALRSDSDVLAPVEDSLVQGKLTGKRYVYILGSGGAYSEDKKVTITGVA